MLACSIILDARASGAGLPRYLKALSPLIDQPDELLELLLVDDTEDPRLSDLAQRHLARLLICHKTPLGGRLNSAVTLGQAEILVFPAQGLTPSIDWLSRATRAVENDETDCVLLAHLQATPLEKVRERLRPGSPSSTLCLSRSWFERIGGCDPDLDSNALPDLLDRLRACQARVTDGNS
jgi:hypothetical protein